MSLSEFRYNKKRKHYSYIYGEKGDFRKNLLLSSKSFRKVKKNGRYRIISNIKLQRHPNPNCHDDEYVMNRRYLDCKDDFGNVKRTWSFDTDDRRKIKRLKKGKKV